MNISYHRASSIGAWKTCEFKYLAEYILGIPGLENSKANLGNVVHRTLEIYARAKRNGHYKLNDKYINQEYLCRICFDRYNREHPEFNWGDKERKFVYDNVGAVLKSPFNPLNLTILDVEKQFDIEINKPGFGFKHVNYITGQEETGNLRLRGTMDLVTEVDKDTIEVIDYKSGSRIVWMGDGPKEFEHFIKDTQLKVYNLATSVIYPQYKHRLFTIFFTRDGGPFTVTFTEEDLENTVDELYKCFIEIKNSQIPKRLKDDRTKGKHLFICKYLCQLGGRGQQINGKNACDVYYNLLRNENSLEKAAPKIYNLSVEGRPISDKVSRRNDYGRSKIFKGTYGTSSQGQTSTQTHY